MSSKSDNKSGIHPKKSEPPATLSDFIAEGKTPDYNTQAAKSEGPGGKKSDKKGPHTGDGEHRDAFDHPSSSDDSKGREGMIADNETRDD